MKNPMTITFFLVGLGLYSIILSTLRGGGELFDYINIQRSLSLLKQNISKLEKKAQNLEHEIFRIKNSREYAKKVLKDRYHLTDENESIMFFAD